MKIIRDKERTQYVLRSEECCLRVVYAISQELNERWRYKVAKTIQLAQEGLEHLPAKWPWWLKVSLLERIQP